MKIEKERKRKAPKLWRMIFRRILLFSIVFITAAGLITNYGYRNWAVDTVEEGRKELDDMLYRIQQIENSEYALTTKAQIGKLLSSKVMTNLDTDNELPNVRYWKITERKTGELVVDSRKKAFLTADYGFTTDDFYCEDQDVIDWASQIEEEVRKKSENPSIRVGYKFDFYVDVPGQLNENYRNSHYSGFLNTGKIRPRTAEVYFINRKTGEIELFEQREFELSPCDWDNTIRYGTGFHDYQEEEQSIFLNVLGGDHSISEDSFPIISVKDEGAKNYYLGRSEAHFEDYPILVQQDYRYSNKFWVGDFQNIERKEFSVKKKNSVGDYKEKQYVLEYYYKTNYWELYGQDIMKKWAEYFAGLLLVLVLVTVAEYVFRKSRFEREEYRRILTNSLSHDLKTPLTSLQGYAESLQENLNNEKKEDYVQGILDNAAYMDHLLHANTELLRLENMGAVKEKEMLDLVEVSEGLFEKYAPALKDRNIKLEFLGSCKKKANKELISEALENLISNAVKYSNDGGEITIEGTTEGFTILNSTNDIPAEDAKKLWEPFVKGDAARSGEKGSGLGLAIAAEIFKKHRMKAKIEYGYGALKSFAVRVQ